MKSFEARCSDCNNLVIRKRRAVEYVCKQCQYSRAELRRDREATKLRKAAYYQQNKDKFNKVSKKAAQKYIKTVKGLATRAARQSQYRAEKLKATIGDYSLEIKEIYRSRPEGYHVDHIIPLCNNLICGLHVPWNLQYLPMLENIRKNNKLNLKEQSCNKTSD